jgi:hypothetical protein
MHEPILLAIKTGLVTIAGGVLGLAAEVLAQALEPPFEGIGSVGLIGLLAVLVGRYTFKQLEAYRGDLTSARGRIDALEEALHKAGQASAKKDDRIRELENYAHRLRLYITAQGIPDGEIPPPPPSAS